MKIIEYRIFMPLTIDENLIGQLWSFAENSRLNTGGGEGVVIQANHMFQVPYDEQKNVIFKNLPNYVEYKGSSSKEKENEGGASSNSHHKKNSASSGGGIFKKSSSKDNFKSKENGTAMKKSDTETSMNNHNNNNNTNQTQSSSSSASLTPTVHPMRSKSLDRPDSSISVSNVQTQILQSDNKANIILDSNNNNNNSQSEASCAISQDDRTKLNEDGTTKNGQYTHKLYFIASKLPWYIRKLLPKDSTIIHERSWNMYPVVKTVLKSEYFKNTAHIELDTITRECANGVPEENVHNLSADELEKREIVNIDITDTFGEYKEDEDPTLFKSKTGRGPLTRHDWIAKQTPLICCYKLVHVDFKVFGLQTKVENYAKNMYKSLFGIFHKQVFCWMDKWCDLDLAEVRKIEEDLAKLLVKKIEQGEVTKQQLSTENEKE
jgi:hypothetical protein